MKISKATIGLVKKAGLKPVFNLIMAFFYFGHQYKCIICGGTFRNFLPAGLDNEIAKSLIGGGRRRMTCPKCNSSDRERLIYFYIQNKTNIFSEQGKINLLHIAPEKNLRKFFQKRSNIKYIAGDLYPEKNDKKIDVTDLKEFKENFFDVIICSHVLEHVPDDLKAMRKLYGVLSPGGFAILQVPISKKLSKTYEDFSIVDPIEREMAFGQRDHVRIYGKDYIDRLKSVGFKVIKYNIAKDLNRAEIEKYKLNPEEILFVCQK